MSDESALLAAIAAHPDEDTPRLMYADWLDEHNRPIRAEFIRVQIEIARKEHLPRAELNRYVPLYERNQELIDNHRADLLGPLADWLDVVFVEFHRGFIARIETEVDHFLELAPLLTNLRPLSGVRVTDVGPRLMDFLRCPDLAVVTEVAVFAYLTGDAPHRPDEGDLRSAAKRLTRLSQLNLEGCRLGDWICDQFGVAGLPALADLDLSHNDLTDGAIDSLLASALPRQLRRLILGGNDITDAGAVALAERWPTGAADRLEHLNLRFTQIGQIGQAALLTRFGGRVDLF